MGCGNMTFTERLCNRRNWLEALGLCLLFHLSVGILLSEITCHVPENNTFEQFISVMPVTETIEEQQAVYGVVQQPVPSLAASNKVLKKIQTAAPLSRMAGENAQHHAQSMSRDQHIDSQKQSDSAVSSIATVKEDVSSVPLEPFKQGDSQAESENEDMHPTGNAGTPTHTDDFLHGNERGLNVAAGENKKETSADMLADYKQYLKTSIECAKQYPLIARRRGEEGKVGVVFELDRFGRLLASRIAMSSGSVVLDEAAIHAVTKAAPFSRPPVEDSSLSFMVVLDFKLSNRS